MSRAPDDLGSGALELVRRLVEASQVDTVYRDLYVRRARTALLTATVKAMQLLVRDNGWMVAKYV